MANNQFEKYNNIPQEKFTFASSSGDMHDKKLSTKPVGFFKDAFNRFKKNKASSVAAIIILLLVLYALIGPFFGNSVYQKAYETDTLVKHYEKLLPRVDFLEGTGIWDGSKKVEISSIRLTRYEAMAIEMGRAPIQERYGFRYSYDTQGDRSTLYQIRINTYYSIQPFDVALTKEEYQKMQEWQDENNIQVILPRIDTELTNNCSLYDVWYISTIQGKPQKLLGGYDKFGKLNMGDLEEGEELIPAYLTAQKGANDEYTSSLRLDSDPGKNGDMENRYLYCTISGKDFNTYNVRVNPYNFFIYKYGSEPSFLFGTDVNGYDIFTRLAQGARFSFLLAILVSVINLTIGAIYGAIEGYYGGVIDLFMERFSDILSGVPFMVVTVLFQMHLAKDVGIVGSLIYSFILTGWIGMAGRMRMQFYRFKNQEYVLAARTLGAKDWRIIWKHIFPNTLGTIITSTILVIPGVIFSETSLSYLGIINLDGPTMSSVGSMLSAGQKIMTSSPHAVFFPALFIALLEISFNLFGNGLRDAFNPSLRGSEE